MEVFTSTSSTKDFQYPRTLSHALASITRFLQLKPFFEANELGNNISGLKLEKFTEILFKQILKQPQFSAVAVRLF